MLGLGAIRKPRECLRRAVRKLKERAGHGASISPSTWEAFRTSVIAVPFRILSEPSQQHVPNLRRRRYWSGHAFHAIQPPNVSDNPLSQVLSEPSPRHVANLLRRKSWSGHASRTIQRPRDHSGNPLSQVLSEPAQGNAAHPLRKRLRSDQARSALQGKLQPPRIRPARKALALGFRRRCGLCP